MILKESMLNDHCKGIQWGFMTRTYEDKDRAILLRSLPLTIPEKYKKKRADTHLWPKGTFIQLGKMVPVNVTQRRQQSHDLTEWKGNNEPVDFSNYINSSSFNNKSIDIDITTKDEDVYAFSLGICEYVSPESLFQKCMSLDDERSITQLSYKEALDLTLKELDKGLINLDSDNEDCDTDITITISLLCPMSMKEIQVPVRGKNCKHLQCFDLFNYLKTNSVISGSRWRCGLCEDFIPIKDLIVDGLVVSMLEKCKGNISIARDKVMVSKDGKWRLLDENRLRNAKRKKNSNEEQKDKKRVKTDTDQYKPEEIVIDIDD
jgi:hypothetical protein